jgi:hypothetical protein
MTGLFLSGLRTIAMFINNSPSVKFKTFIRTLFKPVFDTNNIAAFTW